MAVKLYVGAVAILATAAAVVAGLSVPPPMHLTVWAVVLLGVLVAMTEYLVVRYFHNNEIDALNLMEGVLGTLVFVASGAVTVLVCVAGLTLANVLRRNSPLKSVFNVAQWTLAAGTAAVLLHALRPADIRDQAGMLPLAMAILLMAVINFVAMRGVLAIATGSPTGAADTHLRGVLMGHAITYGASVVTGICLSAAVVWSPWALLAGVAIVIGSHLAGRANASLHADGARLAGLQCATHVLATSLTTEEAVPSFLGEVQRGFQVRAAEVVIFGARESVTHRVAESTPYASCAGQHLLANTLAGTLTEPMHISAGSGAVNVAPLIEGAGYQRVLAAPLRTGESTVGMLLLYDRVGMEGFESGELSVAAALARELVGFLERVTLLQAIEDERRKLADILGNTSDGIFSMEADGTITSWNAGLAGMTGYAADEIVGTRHFGLLRPRDAHGRDLYIERWVDLIDTPAGMPTDVQIVAQSGESVWLSCSYSRIPATEPGRDVLVVVARNITQARELERLKDDFVAVVSHELRTPLVPIKGWAQTLLNRGDRLNDDQRRTAVQSILAQAQKLESLVLNILEASRIEAGRTDGDGVADVVGIAARIVEDTLASRPDRTLRLRPPSVPCNVKGSSVWVERSVANLIANAIKYSPDDEPVDVVISTEGDDVLVSVTDRGPGIAADAQERIFERFERLEETRKQTGTGLGLYITRRLARAMGGDVTVSSLPGAGSTFLLRLPVAPVSVTASTRLPDQRAGEANSQERSNVVQLH
jgi:PAS domain S-box-containing protein